MIDIQNLGFGYSRKKAKVFEDFSLLLEQNCIYGLLGENGMGKSTLLYLMMGLLHPQEGSIRVDGMEARARKAEMLEQMYIVPETFELPRMRFMNYVETYRPFYEKFSMEVLEQCMSEFNLPLTCNVQELSMGEKKKVLMSFALACNTRYLLMDEPTNGLDVPSKRQFRKVIASNMNEERTIIIATHQLHDVEQLLDHILILKNSQLMLNQSVAELGEKYSFGLLPTDIPEDSIVYSERTVQGDVGIWLRQPEDAETSVELEMLFNAAVQNKL
ncbi:MAG: ATP-binding cassette domain-containing protein [Bacteroidaceae bacterium]|nr:ATP-binding cassette domain-containing protein [Bacteroidaceae bacterium]